MKTPMTQQEKENFIDFLANASPDDMTEFVRKNGKNNSKDMLFVFQWDKLKKDGKHKK